MTTTQSTPSTQAEPLPPRPEAGDCCGGGCAVCVLDGYQEEVERWEKQVAEILARRQPAQDSTPDRMGRP
jgi:hypothetical protein